MINIIKYSDANWIDTFCDFLIKNQPCIFSKEFTDSWPARTLWVCDDDKPNYAYLHNTYGKCVVPILASDGCSYEQTTLGQYLYGMVNDNPKPKAYLKDWHFQSSVMKKEVYDLPLFLQFDWINNEKWTSDTNNPFGGDYRFVYVGAQGTWTKFHCDVMNSYSWSANICGRKLWFVMEPGKEMLFMKNGQLIEDLRECQDRWKDANLCQFIQEPGQIVFIPSKWHHQEDTISINHNFINSCNIDYIIELMSTRLHDVIREIEDVRPILSMDEFEEKCQLILNADVRINVPRFRNFLTMIIDDRSNDDSSSSCWTCNNHTSIFECKKNDFCVERIRSYLKKYCTCNSHTSLCSNCAAFIRSFELTCALHAKFLIDCLIDK